MRLQLDEHGGYIELLDQSLAVFNPAVWVTNVAAIARGKHESVNPAKRFEALLKEAEGEQASRPLEFYPLAYDWAEVQSFIDSHEDPIWVEWEIKRWGTLFPESGKYQTTGRLAYNIKMPPPTNMTEDDIKTFSLFRAKVPMFSWAQIVTHTQLSTEAQSDRVSAEGDYWLPEDLDLQLAKIDISKIPKPGVLGKISRIMYADDSSFYLPFKDIVEKFVLRNFPSDSTKFKAWMIEEASQSEVQEVLKLMGYPREIFGRGPYYFKMKEFVIAAYANEDRAWPHFLRERSAYANDGGPKNWTQEITRKFAESARMILEAKNKLSKDQVLERRKS